jgi:Tol biopolymer transport system component
MSAGGLAVLWGCLLLMASCKSSSPQISPLPAPTQAAATVLLTVDGDTRLLATTAATVGEMLEDAGIALSPADEVRPPLSTAIPADPDAPPLSIMIVRVTETVEVIPESIPYERRVVRSAEMSPDDPPRILQTGAPGLQEISVRIVFHDGLEAERWPTAVTVIEPAVDEIIMIGVSADRDVLTVSGRLAYLNNGRAIILEGSTDTPRQLSIEGAIDGRVFQLSPDGRFLLYTLATNESDPGSFRNELWVIATTEEAQPRSLQIENVLWAAWDPAALEAPRIAYSTARSIALPPGWEAINDLWLLTLPAETSAPAPTRLIETYPAAFGWWGGNYAWSPDGRWLAYAFADEVGLLDMSTVTDSESQSAIAAQAEPARTSLHTFEPYDTGADWAWLPALSWSADSRHLAFTAFAEDQERFDLHLVDSSTLTTFVVREGAGIWSASQWSPAAILPDAKIAYLEASDPATSQDSSYALWIVDGDGSNKRRAFPPEGEAGQFARNSFSLTWGPDPDSIAFIFDDELHILDVPTGDVFRAEADDTVSSLPTWAPYGAAATP